MKPKKNYTLFFIAVVNMLAVLASCSDKNEFIEMISGDNTKPDPIKDYRITNFNGGAYIIYDLPKSDNILYVKAKYYLGDGTDRPVETRSSYFSDTTTVEGFAKAKEYEVKLTVVSRANIESDPIVVKVAPLTPVYQLVAANLTLTPDFAGVRVQSKNDMKKNVGIVFLDDALGTYSIRLQSFSSLEAISFPVRGYDTLPKVYAAYVTDKWGNRSDTIRSTVKPLYEKRLDPRKFSPFALSGNETPILGGYPLTNLFDADAGGNPNVGSFWHTGNPDQTGGTLPQWGTFSLGTYAKLSRIKLTPRDFNIFIHNNPKLFSIWGSASERPGPFVPPAYADEGTRLGESGEWENLGNFSMNDPVSGAARSAATAGDLAEARKGQDFDIRFDAPKVRYIRLVVSTNMSNGVIINAADISFWGDER